MKRVLKFILLKVAEILGAWTLVVDVPWIVGHIASYSLFVDVGNVVEVWFSGFFLIIICVGILFVLYTIMGRIFFFDEFFDWSPGDSLFVQWIKRNWKMAGE
jgi:hypothetical protein